MIDFRFYIHLKRPQIPSEASGKGGQAPYISKRNKTNKLIQQPIKQNYNCKQPTTFSLGFSVSSCLSQQKNWLPNDLLQGQTMTANRAACISVMPKGVFNQSCSIRLTVYEQEQPSSGKQQNSASHIMTSLIEDKEPVFSEHKMTRINPISNYTSHQNRSIKTFPYVCGDANKSIKVAGFNMATHHDIHQRQVW